MTYFGVNYLLGGMHSYGGGFRPGYAAATVFAAVTAFALLTVAALIRQRPHGHIGREHPRRNGSEAVLRLPSPQRLATKASGNMPQCPGQSEIHRKTETKENGAGKFYLSLRNENIFRTNRFPS